MASNVEGTTLKVSGSDWIKIFILVGSMFGTAILAHYAAISRITVLETRQQALLESNREVMSALKILPKIESDVSYTKQAVAELKQASQRRSVK